MDIRCALRRTLRAPAAVLLLTNACGGGDTKPSPVYIGTLDPIIFVGQTASPQQLVSTTDGRPLPAALKLEVDSGDAASFVVAGSSLAAVGPGVVVVDVTDGATAHTTVHVAALYDTRGKWLYRAECPWVSDATDTRWHITTVRSEFTNFQSTTVPTWVGTLPMAATTALATQFDTTIHIHHASDGSITGDTSAQSAPIAVFVRTQAMPTLQFERRPLPGAGELTNLPVVSTSPLIARNGGQIVCGGVSSSDPLLARSSVVELVPLQ